ncbi:MAG: hypothetical protein ACLFV6_04395 [Spirulinaceae cyanobacterium]
MSNANFYPSVQSSLDAPYENVGIRRSRVRYILLSIEYDLQNS